MPIRPNDSICPGDIIGEYKIERLVGSGGMGAVYLAQHTELPWIRAIKIINTPNGSQPAEVRERWKVECSVLGELTHPNIVRIYHAGIHKGKPYLVMEYLEGETLQQHIEEQKISHIQAVARAADVAYALDAVHSRGILHRDIKPANILIDKKDTTRLIDFGISQLAGTDLGITRRYGGADIVIGSMHYLAPERIVGDSPKSPSDMYSLGKVLYHSLLGVPDATGTDPSDLASMLYEFTPKDLARKFGSNINDITHSLPEHDPFDRPTALEAHQALSSIVATYKRCENTTPIKKPMKTTLDELANDIANEGISEDTFADKYGLFILLNEGCYRALKNPNETAQVPKADQVFVIPKDANKCSWKIGRENADLEFTSKPVSRHHATIYALRD